MSVLIFAALVAGFASVHVHIVNLRSFLVTQLTDLNAALDNISAASGALHDALDELAARVTADDVDPAELQDLVARAQGLAEGLDTATTQVAGIEPAAPVEVPPVDEIPVDEDPGVPADETPVDPDAPVDPEG